MAQPEHKEQSVPFCSPLSACSTTTEVTEGVGLNPSGTGSRSPGLTYQNTLCCSDKPRHQQLPGKGVHWLLSGSIPQRKYTRNTGKYCISRHNRCHQHGCLQCACQVPYFLHLLRGFDAQLRQLQIRRLRTFCSKKLIQYV